jgi:hypothetical protein
MRASVWLLNYYPFQCIFFANTECYWSVWECGAEQLLDTLNRLVKFRVDYHHSDYETLITYFQ